MSPRHVHFLLSCSIVFQVEAQVIPLERITDWAGPGSYEAFIPTQSLNILNYGADPSGMQSCNAALQAAIAALGGPGEVYFPAGQYAFAQTIVLPDSIVLQGETDLDQQPLAQLLVSPGENADGILVSGSEQSMAAIIVELPVKDDRFIRVDQPSLFNPGMVLRLTATDDSLLVNDWWGVGQTGQIVEVESVNGDSLHFAKPLRRSYAGAPSVRHMLPRRQVHLRCLAIERQDATASQSVNVFFRNALDCSMRGIDSHLGNYAHINIWRSARITIENCHFKDAHAYNSGGKGYGVLVDFGTCDSYIHQNTFEHLRHSMILQAGANGNVFAYNHSTDPFWSSFPFPSNSAGDIVLHGNYPYMNLFEGNVVQNIVIDNSHNINGPYNTLFRNRAELYGIFMNTGPASNDQNFIGNQVTNTTGGQCGLYALQGTGHFAFGNQIKGTIQPGGTGEPLQSSLFDYAFPSFYPVMSSIPPIRTDNWQSTEPLIQAEYRKEVLGMPAVCADSIFDINTTVGHEPAPGDGMRLFPDPADGELVVEGNGAIVGPWRIVDALGREVLRRVEGGQRVTIDVSSLPAGTYTVLFDMHRASFQRFVKR
jgi:hypothetical protein